MKNKFKKSKIIVPALALITATTVASVTGTVAWFTAARSVTVSGSKFESVTEGKGLTVVAEVISNCGATVGTVSGNEDAAVAFDGLLTHGSYEANAGSNGNVYRPIISDDANVTGFESRGSVTNHLETTGGDGTSPEANKWISGYNGSGTSKKTVWYAIAWKLNFTQTNTNSNVQNHLLLDVSSSSFSTSENKKGENSTFNGFRIALMTSSNFVVLGGSDTTKSYVSSSTTDTSGYGEYTNIYVPGTTASSTKGGAYYKAVDSTSSDNNSDVTNNYAYLGTINDNGTTATEVTCVAWFEGSDPSVTSTYTTSGATPTTSDRVMSDITASLSFYSRKTVVTTGA